MILTAAEPTTIDDKIAYAIADLTTLFATFYTEEQMVYCLTKANNTTWVVKKGSLIVGSLVCVQIPKNPFESHIVFLGVHPNYDKVYEEELLDTFLRSCKAKVVTSSCNPDDFDRIDLMLSRGFEISGESVYFEKPQITFRRSI